jgi:hypothetical protein
MIDARVRAGLWWAFLAVLVWSFTVPLTKVVVGGFDAVFTATGRAVIWLRRRSSYSPRSALFTALMMPLSEAVVIDGSMPTPHSTRSPTAHSR